MADTNTNETAPDITEFADELATIADRAAASDTPALSAPAAAEPATVNRDLVMRIPVVMKVVIGGATIPVATLSRMRRGEIIKLDRRAGDPADIVVNGRTLAKGKIIVVDEATGQLGISLTEIVGPRSSDA